MPGPGKKPEAIKAISGTCRNGRVVVDGTKFQSVEYVPEPPDWLPNSHAVKEWNRLAPLLVANKLLTEAGVSALGMLCALHGKCVQLFAAGESPTGHMMSQLRGLVNDFGLTPVAQGKIKPISGGDDNDNPFTKHKKPPKK